MTASRLCRRAVEPVNRIGRALYTFVSQQRDRPVSPSRFATYDLDVPRETVGVAWCEALFLRLGGFNISGWGNKWHFRTCTAVIVFLTLNPHSIAPSGRI